MENGEMPVGFSMALAQNPRAMRAFVGMDEISREQLLARSRNVSSKDEMRRLIDDLA